jgi:hypothetical protein
MDREELLRLRFERLMCASRLSPQDVARFRELDREMTDEHLIARASMTAFHNGREYRSLLKKIVEGLVYVREPHADEKHSVLLQEMATMDPAVFLTPWEMTLEYLDRQVGSIADVEKEYGG